LLSEDFNMTMLALDRFVVKRKPIDHATSGDNELVAAVPRKKIVVLACLLISVGDITVRFESGAGGTALTGQMTFVQATGFALQHNPVGWFETSAGEALNLELSSASSVDGVIVYIEV
jgi:hypothetical protein